MPQDLKRVCQEWFPNKKYPERSGFLMDVKLQQQLEIAVKNIVHDWDFTIIISGGGEVRVGKSVFALQIMCYWAYQIEKIHNIVVPFNLKENIVFTWRKLIEKGNTLGAKAKFSPFCYDEAGETMEGTKTSSRELRAVRDFLRECGQYNFLNILVMPEFFDLPKGIAITRSVFLLDVYYTSNDEGLFQRGFFKFYSRRNKKQLYIKGKKELNYNAHRMNFQGEFRDFYPVSEDRYRKLKQEALRDRETGKRDKLMDVRDMLFSLVTEQFGIKQEKLSNWFKENGMIIPQTTISGGVNRTRGYITLSTLNKKI